MKMHVVVVFALLFAIFPSRAEPVAPRQDALQVVEQEKVFVLSVPVSRLVMLIPRGQLVFTENKLGGAASSPRYFYFADRGFNISGWFEPAQSFPGMRKFWEDETQAWKRKGLPDPIDVIFRKIDGWDAIIYDTPTPIGKISHIRAHWVQAGTWIDIHLSLMSSTSTADIRASLENYLKAVQVKEFKQ